MKVHKRGGWIEEVTWSVAVCRPWRFEEHGARDQISLSLATPARLHLMISWCSKANREMYRVQRVLGLPRRLSPVPIQLYLEFTTGGQLKLKVWTEQQLCKWWIYGPDGITDSSASLILKTTSHYWQKAFSCSICAFDVSTEASASLILKTTSHYCKNQFPCHAVSVSFFFFL